MSVIGYLATGFDVLAHCPATDDCAEQIAGHASIEILSAFDRYQDSPELVLGKREAGDTVDTLTADLLLVRSGTDERHRPTLQFEQ